jgi:hypothetical protein
MSDPKEDEVTRLEARLTLARALKRCGVPTVAVGDPKIRAEIEKLEPASISSRCSRLSPERTRCRISSRMPGWAWSVLVDTTHVSLRPMSQPPS